MVVMVPGGAGELLLNVVNGIINGITKNTVLFLLHNNLFKNNQRRLTDQQLFNKSRGRDLRCLSAKIFSARWVSRQAGSSLEITVALIIIVF